MSTKQILDKYVTYFENKGHKHIDNAPLVPLNDPSTLFTSSGMQPLIPYLLGEKHPLGERLVNAQNCFRSVDIDEVGDNRHTTFFRMLGNWSLGSYFKKEQLPWLFDFLIDPKEGLGLDPTRLYITVFEGYKEIPKDTESIAIWQSLFQNVGLSANEGERIFAYGVDKNWWSRSGTPEQMPVNEPGGPDTEVFFDFLDPTIHENSQFKNQKCHVNCDCGRYLEIGNSVFMQYRKSTNNTFVQLPKSNVDFGGGLERFLLATQDISDMFLTSLFSPIITSIEKSTNKKYEGNERPMRIIADHLRSACYIAAFGIVPSNSEQGYILRRLIRRSIDNFHTLSGTDLAPIITSIIEVNSKTDQILIEKSEQISLTIIEEANRYRNALKNAKLIIDKELAKQTRSGDEILGEHRTISAELAFKSLASYGISPSQLKSLGYDFNEQELAEKIKEHQAISRKGNEKKFKGGLADTSEKTIHGHTATHLLHQALRDVLDNSVHQSGSNITSERIRFDFSYDKKITDQQLLEVENIVNGKIKEDLPVHFEIIPTKQAYEIGAIGLFMDTYGDKSKIYFIGPKKGTKAKPYSIEFCGGPHVNFTGELKSFKIIKQESLGLKQRRIYAVVE